MCGSERQAPLRRTGVEHSTTDQGGQLGHNRKSSRHRLRMCFTKSPGCEHRREPVDDVGSKQSHAAQQVGRRFT
jgi:hypothetical protein